MRELDTNYVSEDRTLALRIAELLKLDPDTVSASGFRVYKNHVVYRIIDRTKIDSRKHEFIKKTHTRRNPLPSSAWE